MGLWIQIDLEKDETTIVEQYFTTLNIMIGNNGNIIKWSINLDKWCRLDNIYQANNENKPLFLIRQLKVASSQKETFLGHWIT